MIHSFAGRNSEVVFNVLSDTEDKIIPTNKHTCISLNHFLDTIFRFKFIRIPGNTLVCRDLKPEEKAYFYMTGSPVHDVRIDFTDMAIDMEERCYAQELTRSKKYNVLLAAQPGVLHSLRCKLQLKDMLREVLGEMSERDYLLSIDSAVLSGALDFFRDRMSPVRYHWDKGFEVGLLPDPRRNKFIQNTRELITYALIRTKQEIALSTIQGTTKRSTILNYYNKACKKLDRFTSQQTP